VIAYVVPRITIILIRISRILNIAWPTIISVLVALVIASDVPKAVTRLVARGVRGVFAESALTLYGRLGDDRSPGVRVVCWARDLVLIGAWLSLITQQRIIAISITIIPVGRLGQSDVACERQHKQNRQQKNANAL
jgi:hypothetical protein